MANLDINQSIVIDVKDNDYTNIILNGDYDFTVEDVSLQTYSGQSKAIENGCYFFLVRMSIRTDEGRASCFDRLYLNEKNQWKVARFAVCVGLAKNGEAFALTDIRDKAPGQSGRATFRPHEYNGNRSNEVVGYILPDADDEEEEL